MCIDELLQLSFVCICEQVEITCYPEQVTATKVLQFINPFAFKHELHTCESQ